MKTEQTLSTEVVTANSEQLAVLKSNFPQCFDRQGKFILSKNSLNKIICEISFRKNQDLFLPRIEFRKIVLKNDEPFKSRGNDVSYKEWYGY